MTTNFILIVSITLICSYIMGSINGALIVSKVFHRKDIRDFGSGNAGLTNTYRTFGTRSALAVLLIDVLKTILPVIAGGFIFGYYIDTIHYINIFSDLSLENSEFLGKSAAGFSVMTGHCFPLFYRFKGGKGVMAIGAIILMLNWKIALIGWGVFVLIVLITRYVSLGSIIGSIALPVTMLLFDIGDIPGLIMVSLCVCLLIVRHAGNMQRLLAGKESKINFKRNKGKSE